MDSAASRLPEFKLIFTDYFTHYSSAHSSRHQLRDPTFDSWEPVYGCCLVTVRGIIGTENVRQFTVDLEIEGFD
jgi:hypothetical protein